ncbi:MAG: cupredoxin domain-containing protein [Nitrosopumilaceae archaeon]
MKSKPIGSLFVVLTLISIIAFIPSAFADKSVSIAIGSGASQNATCISTHNCFIPNPVNVTLGETVTWTNTDSAPNTVTSGTPDNSTGSVFESGLIKAGETFAFKFTNAGTYNYFSEIHPWMVGQVIVEPASASGNSTSINDNGIPEFGPIASLVLVIAIVSVVAMTAKTRGFLKL